MKKLDFKRTLNLHEYNIRFQRIFSDWKFMLPLSVSVIGILTGTALIRGESSLYNKAEYLIEEYLLANNYTTVPISIIIHLLIPTLLAVIIFFMGLSVYGGLISNVIPFIFSTFIGIITYYMYSEYTLKGLAYCVIMLLPYTTLSLYSLLLITAESICMSQYLLNLLSRKRRKTLDYSINKYYINSIKSYVIIIIASVVKTGIEYLFVGLFSF